MAIKPTDEQKSYAYLGDVVGDKILLKQQVADILLILEHVLDCRC